MMHTEDVYHCDRCSAVKQTSHLNEPTQTPWTRVPQGWMLGHVNKGMEPRAQHYCEECVEEMTLLVPRRVAAPPASS